MDTNWVVLISVMGCVSCLILAIYYWWPQNRAAAYRLSNIKASGRNEDERDRYYYGRPAMFSLLVPQVAQAIKPRTRGEEKQLKLKMARAGFNNSFAGDAFLCLKVACLIGGGLFGMSFGIAWFGMRQPSLLSAVLGACVTFYIPDLLLGWLTARRQESILLAIPNALDLMIVAIEVGQGLDVAMRRVAEELERNAPELSQELHLYNLQLQMGRSRAEALHELGTRCGVPEMNSVAAVLIQADRFGTSIAKTMRQLSDSSRRKRRQRAEERAQKTAVKLIFPLVLFIFPGIFAVLVGPAAILLMRDLSSMQ